MLVYPVSGRCPAHPAAWMRSRASNLHLLTGMLPVFLSFPGGKRVNIRHSILAAACLLAAGMTGIGPSVAETQVTKKQSNCTRVGGKAVRNPDRSSEFPYLCRFPDKYSKACERKHGEDYYYDLDTRRCEDSCDADPFGDDCW